MAREDAELVVAGHICLDIIPRFEGGAARLDEVLVPGKLVNVGPAVVATGGAVSNTGLALHRLGFAARLMGKVGDDLFGQAILDVLRQHGRALAEWMLVSPEAPTSYTVVINPPGVDRMFLHCPAANDAFGAEDIAYDRLRGAALFHFGYPPLMRRMYADGGRGLAQMLRRVKELGLTTSLDMAKPDPASEAGRARWGEVLARALPHTDLFLPSLDETLYMVDPERCQRMERERGPRELAALADGELLSELAARLLELGAAVVGLKLGTEGFYLRTTADAGRLAGVGRLAPAEPEEWRERELLAPCFQVEVVGTTGAGDSTVAGFLAGWASGLSPEEAMQAAVGVGACSVEAADASSGIPTWGQVRERIAGGWPRREVGLRLEGWRWEERLGVWRSGKDRQRGGLSAGRRRREC